MGVFDKLKNAMGLDYEDDDEDEEELEEAEEKKPAKSFVPEAPSLKTAPVSTAAPKEPLLRNEQKIDLTRTMGSKTMEMKMVVVEPQSFDECPKLVDNLKAKKPIVINLENLDADSARKIFDFLSGATYALNGNVQRISNNIFLFAPANVDITYNSTQKSQIAEAPVRSPWK